MAVILREVEAAPTTYPEVPEGVTSDPAVLWQRIDAHCRLRWSPREVVWTIEGDVGEDWVPPLEPVVSQTAEIWDGEGWVGTTMPPGPLGLSLPCSGMFRITATVGGGDMPATVSEAIRRLSGYISDGRSQVNEPGASSFSFTMSGALSWDMSRDPAWMARALQNSGAADLLRPYRRLK